MLCFAGQNVPRKMDGEACPRGGCETVPAVIVIILGSAARCSWQFRLHFDNFELLVFLKDVSHKSFVFTSSTLTFGGRSRTKASFSHLQLSLLEDCARNSFCSFLCCAIGCFKSHWSGCVKVALRCCWARSSILFFNWVLADRIVMAASRPLVATDACVILLSFAAGHRKSFWNGCIQVAMVICQQIFSILAPVIFLFKVLVKPFQNRGLELQFLALLCVVLLCFATGSLQTAL